VWRYWPIVSPVRSLTTALSVTAASWMADLLFLRIIAALLACYLVIYVAL
jgi:hypothetical protein